MEENKNIGCMIIEEELLDNVTGGMRPGLFTSDCPVCGSIDLEAHKTPFTDTKCKNCGYEFFNNNK